MNAVILAGGFGKRLQPLTFDTPKPMLKICNIPMLDYCVNQAKYFGINDIVFTLAYLPQKITERSAIYDNVRCRFSIEREPMGTFGGVKLAQEFLDESFFVLSGDGLNNIDLGAMAKSHFDSGAPVTIALTKSDTPWLYGVVETDDSGRVKAFYEKPREYRGNIVNTGVYLMDKKLLSFLPDGCYDFAKDLFPLVLKNASINTYFHDGYWNDIGNPKSYFDSNFFVLKNGGFPWIKKPCVIEKNSSLVGESSRVDGLLDECIIDENCTAKGNFKKCLFVGGVNVEEDGKNAIFTPHGKIQL